MIDRRQYTGCLAPVVGIRQAYTVTRGRCSSCRIRFRKTDTARAAAGRTSPVRNCAARAAHRRERRQGDRLHPPASRLDTAPAERRAHRRECHRERNSPRDSASPSLPSIPSAAAYGQKRINALFMTGGFRPIVSTSAIQKCGRAVSLISDALVVYLHDSRVRQGSFPPDKRDGVLRSVYRRAGPGCAIDVARHLAHHFDAVRTAERPPPPCWCPEPLRYRSRDSFPRPSPPRARRPYAH